MEAQDGGSDAGAGSDADGDSASDGDSGEAPAKEKECVSAELPEGTPPFEGDEPFEYEWRPSGLGVVDHVVGEGPIVAEGAVVTMHYIGYLLDGCVFDASILRGPLTVATDSMLPGMSEGLVGMAVGGRRRLYLPSELAYGDSGAGPFIGPDQVLVFEIEVLDLP